MMTNTCINYQTIMPPVFGDHVAYGDTGVVIYTNSVCGARSNFEGGPSALAAGLTGRTPRYGLHLDQNRKATRRYQVCTQPEELTDWGVLGAVIGKKAGSYWEVPVIEDSSTHQHLMRSNISARQWPAMDLRRSPYCRHHTRSPNTWGG